MRSTCDRLRIERRLIGFRSSQKSARKQSKMSRAFKSRTFNLLVRISSKNNRLQADNSDWILKRCQSNLVNNEPNYIKQTESIKSITNLYTIRTHNCGEVCKDQLNQIVTLAGWIQFIRFKKFLVLRDKYGIVQLIIKDKQLLKKYQNKLRLESIVVVSGQVIARPDGEVNSEMTNGDIEIDVKDIKLFNECDSLLPVNFNELYKTSEDLCLKHRYIHLRSPNLQSNLQARSDFVYNIRKFLIEKLKFVEIETPTLFKNTPGGANEYVVPTRFKDNYYTLTQSPQQFKQLLMIGSLDKYFQIARCYRDELTRSDRQPEFTQVDLELSFTTSEQIQQLIEHLLLDTWLPQLANIRTPFRRLSYSDCISKYGIDKPDLRLKIELDDLTNETSEQAFAIRIKQGVTLDTCMIEQIRIAIHEKLNHHSKSNKLNGYLIEMKQNKLNAEKIRLSDNTKSVNDANESIETEMSRVVECDSTDWMILNNLKINELNANDCLILCTGNLNCLRDVVGKIRNAIIPILLNDRQVSEANGLENEKYLFSWIVDFPLFTKDETSGELESTHHPFTAPIDQHRELIYENPLAAIGQHYDLVLNGNEIGGGSIRIHDHAMQKHIFENILKSDLNQMNFFLNALKAGCPPHGGIALGLDRLLSIMLDTESIRDVIAFPKTTNGRDLMCEAPNTLDSKMKIFYHLN